MKVYLDNSATTRMDEEVLASMLPYFTDNFGNPSSVHSFGRDAMKAVDGAREKIALLIGAEANEIYFTSGGTESDNWALRGAVGASKNETKHIITTKIEHSAMLETCKSLQLCGVSVTYLDVGENGIVSPEAVEKAIRPDTVLISVMTANNEIGTLQPIKEIGRIARSHNVLFHTDAVQAMSSLKIDVNDMNVDMLSFSAHKFNGPKGVGVLYVRKGTRIDGFMLGGHQESGRRAGTTNTAGIVGTAAALEKAVREMQENNGKIKQLRDYFLNRALSEIPDCRLNGDRERRLVSNANIRFDYVGRDAVLIALDLAGIAAAGGAACEAGSVEPSHVLLALGQSEEQASCAVRFTLGKDNTKEEIDYTVEQLKRAVSSQRQWSTLFRARKERGDYV